MKVIKIGNGEVRLDGDGQGVDEIVIHDGAGRMLFHLERMSDGCFWSAVHDPRGEPGMSYVEVNFTAKGVIKAAHEDLREMLPGVKGD